MLLTGLMTALSSAALMAQTNVYSLNAVGYINVTCAPGFNMIADQLISTNNTLGSLLNDAAGTYDNVLVYSWNGSTFSHDSGDSALSGNANGWDNNGVITMNPGQAVWFQNPNKTNMVLTFVGTVPQGSLTNTLAGSGAFTMASSIVPQSGDLVTNLGLTNFNNGDHVYVFNNTTGAGSYTTYTADSLGGSGYQGLWDPPGDPQVNVGQGFWYQTFKTGGAVSWVRSFSVNQ